MVAGLEAQRAAEVVVTLPQGRQRRGSGYLVASGLVLTAAHVVRGADTIRVRFEADRPGEWSSDARVEWCGAKRADVALLALTSESGPFRQPVDTALFGTVGERDAVLRCSALGFPLFKMRVDPDDGSRARDMCHAWGHIPVLSNRRTGTLEFRVEAPDRDPDPQRSPWQGMSGAAVWAGERIIGVVVEHHRAEGLGSLTVSRTDSWAGQGHDPETGLLRRLGLDRPLPDVVPPSGVGRVAEGYLAQSRSIAPLKLLDRALEVGELVRFCAGPGGYQWWQAPPWHGKTALAAWFAAHPPAGTVVAAFFVTRRQADQCDSDAFARAMAEQLAAVAGESPVWGSGTAGAYAREWQRLLPAAANALRAGGRRLLIVVDGLDEDESVKAPSPLPSIASLLPRHLPEGVSVLVTSRPEPGLPVDLPGDHPLRSCEPRALTASPHARQLRFEAEYELGRLLAEGTLAREVIGLLAASGAGLSREELAELTGTPVHRLTELIRTVLGRSLSVRRSPVFVDGLSAPRGVHVFAHDTLRSAAVRLLGDEVALHRKRIHQWAATYREQGWPQDTPHYLLSGYGPMVLASRDPQRITAVIADPARHDRLATRVLGDGPALAEIRAARRALRDSGPEVPLDAMVRLAVAHDRLLARSWDVDFADLALLRARLRQDDRAQALLAARPDGWDKLYALARLAESLLGRDPQRALDLALAAARLLADLLAEEPSSNRAVAAEAACQVGCTLLALKAPEAPAALHTALDLVAKWSATRNPGGPPTGDPAWHRRLLAEVAQAFGSAGDLGGIRAAWSAARQATGAGEAALLPAVTALIRHGHRAALDRLRSESAGTPADCAEVRAVVPPALIATGSGAEAWQALAEVPPGHEDAVLASMRDAFVRAGDMDQALRAARAVADPARRRLALLAQAKDMPSAGQGLSLIEEACPHDGVTSQWACGGTCAPWRVRALGALGRWEEALALASLPYDRSSRAEVRRQILTVLAQAGRWQEAERLLADYRAQDPPGDWVRAAVTLVYTGARKGEPRAAPLAHELLTTLPGTLSEEDEQCLHAVVPAALARAGRWRELAAYWSSGNTLPAAARSWPWVAFQGGSAALTAEEVAGVLARQPDRVAEAVGLLSPVFGNDAWRHALASACAGLGQWRTAANLARRIDAPQYRSSALTRVAAAIADREAQHAAALADEAERTASGATARTGRFSPASGPRVLMAFAEALLASRPAEAAEAARAATRLNAPEDGRPPADDLRDRAAVVLAHAGETQAARSALESVRDPERIRRIKVALVTGAVAAGRPEEARRLVTGMLSAAEDADVIPECVAVLAAAGHDDQDRARELREAAAEWAVRHTPSGIRRAESLAAVLEHCRVPDRTTAKAAETLTQALDEAHTYHAPATALPVWARAARALDVLDREAAAHCAQGALEAAAALAPRTLGTAPASAVATAAAVLCRAEGLGRVVRAVESLSPDTPDVVRLVLLSGVAAGAVATAPDWAVCRAEEAAQLLSAYWHTQDSHRALTDFALGEAVLDAAIATTRALAAAGEQSAAREVLEQVPSAGRQETAWARTARALAADADQPDADPVTREAARWTLVRALAGGRWMDVLCQVATRDPGGLLEGYAFARAFLIPSVIPEGDTDRDFGTVHRNVMFRPGEPLSRWDRPAP
ncbi:trypsin-like peptidase domain-containing protein [Streptomyces sp. HPF1205]|uniref:trypsin-like peptidase domain-containing protein n=1 Tax=Streptomyces sp. HPF1205 TaxID=2873262 RepID=UPI001CECA32D|nr:trypsin-like peptidase domain-containing protein [Streptomyces sp. HPF1205]